MKKVLIACMSLLFLTGCFVLPTETPPALPPTVAIRYRPARVITTPVTRGDVRDVIAPFTQIAAGAYVSLGFQVGGVPIYGIFVQRGDVVQEGDLLASLHFPGMSEEIYELTRTIANLNMRLEHAEQRLALAHSLARQSGNPADDTRIAYEILDLAAELEVLNWRLDTQNEQDTINRHIWAPKNGVVTNVQNFTDTYQALANTTDTAGTRVRLSTAGSRIITIQGVAEQFFIMRNPAYSHRLNVGDIVDMYINDILFQMEIVDPVEHGIVRRPEWGPETRFLTFVGGEPDNIPGVSGQINVVVAEVFDVIRIPVRDLRYAGGRYFVFLYEDGLRTIRDVVPGIVGGPFVEIISGLQEGELIMR